MSVSARTAAAALFLSGVFLSSHGGVWAADPAFAAPVPNPFSLQPGSGQHGQHLAVADLDGDSDLDVLMGSLSFPGTHFFENTGITGQPEFALPISSPFGLNSTTTCMTPELVDLDGDGDLDMLSGSSTGAALVQLNTGSPTSPAFAPTMTNPFGLVTVGSGAAEFSSTALGDLDGDGDLDLLHGSFLAVTYQKNTGSSISPAFGTPQTSPLAVPGTYSNKPELTDLDGDGDLDVLMAPDSGSLRFHRNTGTPALPAFGPGVTNPFGATTVPSLDDATLADFDQDNDLDLLQTRAANTMQYFRNTAADTVAPTLVGGAITRLDPTTTNLDHVRFGVKFSEGVSPSFNSSDITLIGTLSASGSAFPDSSKDPSHTILVKLANPDANGTIGIRISGIVRDPRGNRLTVPIDSPLYTISNFPKGDVNKSGALDLADVALLADANLGLVTLP